MDDRINFLTKVIRSYIFKELAESAAIQSQVAGAAVGDLKMNTSACENVSGPCRSYGTADIQLDTNVTTFPMVQLSAFPGIYSDRSAFDFNDESGIPTTALAPVRNPVQLRSVRRLAINEIGLPIQSQRTPDRFAQVIQVIVMGACLVALFIAS